MSIVSRPNSRAVIIQAIIAIFVSGYCCRGPVLAVDELELIEFLPSVQQWVVSDGGRLRGRILLVASPSSPPEGLRVRLIESGGGNSLRAVSDAHGDFEFEDVPDGTFTFVASGEGLFASYPVHVRPKEQEPSSAAGRTEPARQSPLAERFLVPLASVSAASVKEFAQRYVPAKLAGTTEPLPLYATDAERPSLAMAAVRGTIPRVGLEQDGTVRGMLLLPAIGSAMRQPAVRMSVRIVSEQRVLAETMTDMAGQFTVNDIPVGNYALVAAGKDGLVVLGFQVVDAIASGAADSPVKWLCAEAVPICEVVRATEISIYNASSLRLIVRGD